MGVACSSTCGTAKPIVNAPSLECYPTEYFKQSEEELLQRGLLCPICMGVIREAVRDKCGHVYGKECITRWLRKNEMCPMSREPILKGLVKDYKVRTTVATLPLQQEQFAQFLAAEKLRGTSSRATSASSAKDAPAKKRPSTANNAPIRDNSDPQNARLQQQA